MEWQQKGVRKSDEMNGGWKRKQAEERKMKE